MAVEARRGCGYRKIGGTYLVGGGIGVPCDRLPLPLTVCPCCGQGIKPTMGWTWINTNQLVQGVHKIVAVCPQDGPEICDCSFSFGLSIKPVPCTFCHEPEKMGRAGLLWIGESFYKTPDEFMAEGRMIGFSRRIRAVPHGFKVGETYVMLAHRKAVTEFTTEKVEGGPLEATIAVYKPGVFYLWLPQAIEKILPESKIGSEEALDLEKRGIRPVFVPDDDPDHQGSVHEDLRDTRTKNLFEEVGT